MSRELVFPALSDHAARAIQRLGPGERDLFVENGPPMARAMSLRHAKAYEFAEQYARCRQVLDLGCGAGNGAVYLSSVGHVTAIDSEKDLVQLLPGIWPERNVSWQHVAEGGLPFPDASFDLVTSFQVIEHVLDQHQFLVEIRRVLREHGVALLTTPNRMLRVAPWQKPWNPYHVKELTSWQLRGLLSRAGFARVRILGLDGISIVTRPERARCLKNMVGPYWMKLPKSLRKAIAPSAASAQPRDLEVAGTEQTFQGGLTDPGSFLGTEAFWWTSRRLFYALDLLAIAHCDVGVAR